MAIHLGNKISSNIIDKLIRFQIATFSNNKLKPMVCSAKFNQPCLSEADLYNFRIGRTNLQPSRLHEYLSRTVNMTPAPHMFEYPPTQRSKEEKYRMMQVRAFASKAGKKDKDKDKKKSCAAVYTGPCPKFDVDNCDTTDDAICSKDRYIFKDCTKKEAPYPCFSEACYEEVYAKPSECKLCPWKPEDHPTFVQKKRKMHTIMYMQRRMYSKEGSNTYESINKGDDPLVTNASDSAEKTYDEVNDLLFSKNFISNDLEALMNQDGGSKLRQVIYQMAKTTCDQTDESGCVKFPFKPMSFEIRKGGRAFQTKKGDKCEERKHKKKIVDDCPPEEAKKDCMGSKIIMSLASKGDDPPDCPTPTHTVCECPSVLECPKKKPSGGGPCPTDLLRKKGYQKKKSKTPAKKASEIEIPPTALPTSNNIQPSNVLH